jgi:hypothetical protein
MNDEDFLYYLNALIHLKWIYIRVTGIEYQDIDAVEMIKKLEELRLKQECK